MRKEPLDESRRVVRVFFREEAATFHCISLRAGRPIAAKCPARLLFRYVCRFFSMLNPNLPSTLTAPVFPPSKSPEPSCWPVANS